MRTYDWKLVGSRLMGWVILPLATWAILIAIAMLVWHAGLRWSIEAFGLAFVVVVIINLVFLRRRRKSG